MSAPFGPSPNLRTYIDWAKKYGGCTVQQGVIGTKSVIRFQSDNGYAFIAGHSDEEPLSHSEVAMLD